MSGKSAPVVEASGLRQVYTVRRGMLREPAHLQAVGNISFTLEARRTLAVVGESGCGKSTLARMVALIEKPTAGTLRLGGIDAVGADAVARARLRQTVQLVFQNPYGSLNPRKTVGSILAGPACRQAKPGPPAAGSAPLALLPRRFEPPADGVLTDRHLDLYGKVRRAARDRSESDAARALGVDPDELAWVRGRVVEALVALDSSRVRDASAETYARAIASLRETLKSVRDPLTSRTVQTQIAALERERAGMRRSDPLPAALAANARKVAARRSELEATLR